MSAVDALEGAGIPYAVAGASAVAAWLDAVPVPPLDILLPREQLVPAIEALGEAGLTFRHWFGVDMFLDESLAKAVRIVYAGERNRADHLDRAPGLEEAERLGDRSVLGLEALVRMLLSVYDEADQAQLRDLIGAGRVNADWVSRVPEDLIPRLTALLP